MKIRISSTDLNAALKDATRAVENKGVVPWMTGVLLEAKDGEVRAACTNGTQTITRCVPCEVLQEGQVLLDGKLLTNVASKMPLCTCVIDASSRKKAVITAEGSKTNMALMDSSAFVLPADVPKELCINAEPAEMLAAVKNVLYAVPAADTRERLTGVNVQTSGGHIHCCGMDGFRMAITKVPTNFANAPVNITIPRKTIADVLGVFPGGTSELTIVTDGKHVQFSNGHVTVQSQLLAGEYPNYKMVVQNTQSKTKAMFDVRQMKNAVERAMVMCADKNNLVKVLVRSEGLTICGIGDIGDATELVECSVNGEEMEIGFNGRLLLEAISAIPDDEAVFQFSSSVGPALLTAVENKNWIHVVLPVRT